MLDKDKNTTAQSVINCKQNQENISRKLSFENYKETNSINPCHTLYYIAETPGHYTKCK